MRDEEFEEYRPRFPQGKVWRVKAVGQPTGLVGPLHSTALTSVDDQSVEPVVERTAESMMPVSAPSETDAPNSSSAG